MDSCGDLLHDMLRLPMKKLDKLLSQRLQAIELLNVRTGRSVEHFIRSELAASTNPHIEVLQIRASLALEAAYSMIRQSLGSLAQLCSQVPSYCSAVDGDKATTVTPTHLIHASPGRPSSEKRQNKETVPKRIAKTSLQRYVSQISPQDGSEYIFVGTDDFLRLPDIEAEKAGNTEEVGKDEYHDDFDHIHPAADLDVPAKDVAVDGVYADDEFEAVVHHIDSVHEQYCDEFEHIESINGNNEVDYERQDVHQGDLDFLDYENPAFEEPEFHMKDATENAKLPASDKSFVPKGIFADVQVDFSAYLRGVKTEGEGSVQTVRKSGRKSSAWNPIPCAQCGQKYRGPGKVVPTNGDEAKDAAHNNKVALKKFISAELEDPQSGLSVSDRIRFINRQEVLQRISKVERKQFCCWKCVKSWVHRNMPPQRRYNTGLLIDLIAGEIV
jgi:hypothetical protein